jgi:hypothetical protein
MPLNVDITETYFYKKGYEVGFAKGLAKAKAERKFAVKMLQAGKYEMQDICDVTLMSMSELIELRNDLPK